VKEGNHDEIDGFGDPLLGVLGAWASVPAFAQGTAPDAVKIAPGVYTTPEISAKCQAYAQRYVRNPDDDISRQRVALACANRLWNDAKKKGVSRKS
jgi:hypothetical protein